MKHFENFGAFSFTNASCFPDTAREMPVTFNLLLKANIPASQPFAEILRSAMRCIVSLLLGPFDSLLVGWRSDQIGIGSVRRSLRFHSRGSFGVPKEMRRPGGGTSRSSA